MKVPIEEKLNEIMGDSLGIESPINADVLSSLSDEQEKKIVEIVNKASLIKITKRHIPEMVDRSLSYHLEFELDKEGMIKFMKDIESFMVDLNKEEIANISSGNDYDEIFDSLKTFKGEIWIGIFDNLPRKVQIDIVAINPSEPADGSLKFKIAARYYDWNKSVAIEAPAVSITIEEFIEKIMGSMMGGSDFDGIFSPTQEEGLDKVEVGKSKSPDQNNPQSFYLKGTIFQKDTDPVPFLGEVNPNSHLQYNGKMSDHWGDSLITEFVADSKSVSFIKKYKQRSDIINYSFKQKKGDIWVGTWNMNKSGITNSTGTVELTLTPFDASN